MPKKRLRVRIGSDFNRESQVTFTVNDEKNPVLIESPHFSGKIVMRINNFKGVTSPLPGESMWEVDADKTEEVLPTCPYFEGKRRYFSLQIQGSFKNTWTANDIEFGIVLDRRINLPTGADAALKIAQVLEIIADL